MSHTNSKMESESGTNNTKISDSGYSHSGSNTTSHESASSKSKHSSGSNSSRSSGYGGAAKTNESDDNSEHKDQEHKDQEHKKKKQNVLPSSAPATTETVLIEPVSAKSTMGVEIALSPLTVSESLGVEVNNEEPLLVNFVPDVQIDKENFITQCEDKLPQTWTEKNPVQKMSENEFDEELLKPDPISSCQPEMNEGFCCVISMDDGVVLYTTPSLTSVLGFPEDMWLGQSFIDFIHPKDRETFSSQVNISIALPLIDSQGKVKDVKNYLYVRLRKQANVKSPSELNVEIPVSYQAFHLTVTIKQITESSETQLYDHNKGLFLFTIAVPVYSAYKVPRERKKSTKFGMRHTATCIFSYVDHDVVTNFGFLPQDMLGKSIFDFYHPEDMPFLKDVYKSVMNTCHNNGSVFRSKPYRFLVQNGCFVLIETEWSCVVNPWSRRLEFIISLHQVLQGPLNPNVFDVTSDEECKSIPQGVISQAKVLQAEIIESLSEELPRPVQLEKQEVSKRCKDLASFVESIMNTSKMEIEVPQEFNPMLERDSAMLGEISPHHDLCDSKSSSEIPPSYSQLNYNENIKRFFQSNPKTTMTSDESNSANNTVDIDEKNSQYCLPCAPKDQKSLSPLQNSRASGSGSAGNVSSSSNPNLESITTSGTNTPNNDDYKPSHLTESLLTRHNADMERIMIQKHKRPHKDRQLKRGNQEHEKRANEMHTGDDTNKYNQGIKRSGSWKEDCFKLSKLNHQSGDNQISEDRAISNNNLISQRIPINPSAQNPPSNNVYRRDNTFQADNNIPLWPTLSLAIAPSSQNSIPLGLPQNAQYAQTMLPVYYVPTLVHPRPVLNSLEPHQAQYIPANLLCNNYNPVFIPQPILCSAVPMVPVSIQDTVTTRNHDGLHFNPKITSGSSGPMASEAYGNGLRPQSDQHQFGINAPSGSRPLPPCDRPSSQATSIKAEPGSTMGSIASASVVNKALSECSRKDLGLQSVCSPDTPLVSPPDGETQAEQFNTTAKVVDVMQQPKQPANSYRTNFMDEESSCYSSSYSSLLKTDNGSNDDSTFNSTTNRTDDEMIKQHRKSYPLRKTDPPWMESVSASSDLNYRYQIAVKDLEEVLKMDRNTLKETQQPMMVNDQLHQLYIEMELNGLSKALKLDESCSSSSSSSDDDSPVKILNSDLPNNPNKKKKSYSSLMMIYEDDAPLPPPETLSQLL